ncbi:hypothetical protein ABZS88_13445 [Streptomyces sp. NPDC005480]|uniref:hypothetical protein n=1 Tax=Streptomyces sp. NPDC005480 TaxID=3154880 RepID=UPI0033A10E77
MTDIDNYQQLRQLDTFEALSAAQGELTRGKDDLSAALWVVKLVGPDSTPPGR